MFASATRSKLWTKSSTLDLVILTKAFPSLIANCSRDIDLKQDFGHAQAANK